MSTQIFFGWDGIAYADAVRRARARRIKAEIKMLKKVMKRRRKDAEPDLRAYL